MSNSDDTSEPTLASRILILCSAPSLKGCWSLSEGATGRRTSSSDGRDFNATEVVCDEVVDLRFRTAAELVGDRGESCRSAYGDLETLGERGRGTLIGSAKYISLPPAPLRRAGETIGRGSVRLNEADDDADELGRGARYVCWPGGGRGSRKADMWGSE